METKPGAPEPDKEQQRSDEEELEDLNAPAESKEEVAGGCSHTCDTDTGFLRCGPASIRLD